jgi:hypothetical protein
MKIDPKDPETIRLLKITKDAQVKNTKLKKISMKNSNKIVN